MLAQTGTPTILAVEVPVAEVDTWLLEELAEQLRDYWPDRRHWQEILAEGEFDASLWFSRSLPASTVVGHTHPASIPDPHDGYREFRWDVAMA